MKFRASFDCGGEAFGTTVEERQAEVARILRKMADRVERGAYPGIAVDTNGNTVGQFGLYSGSSGREDLFTNTEADAGRAEYDRCH